jgi:hypothetical protein
VLANRIVAKTFIAETEEYLLRKFDCDPAIIGLQASAEIESSLRMKLTKDEIGLLKRI